MLQNHSLSQMKPSPINPELQAHVKLKFSTLSLVHTALTSQGLEWHGPGAEESWR